MSLRFVELREKLKLQKGEKLVKKIKTSNSAKEISITDFGGKGFMLYFDGYAIDDSVYGTIKDAEKSAKEFLKLFDA